MITRSITVDFSQKCGRIKPLNGICLGPRFDTLVPLDFTEEYKELGVSFVRTYSSELPPESPYYLDLSRVFPDPMLDERFAESYDFRLADAGLCAVKDTGAAIYLALGGAGYGGHPSAPHVAAEKWARIAERIILHYTRGWGGGFKCPVKLVEIWPGADTPCGFLGGVDAYSRFYITVSRHLKAAFPTLKVGAYSAGGFASLNRYNVKDEERAYVPFLESFLASLRREEGVPLDFLSWRAYVDSPEELSLHATYAKNYLSQYGFRRTLSVVSELDLRELGEPNRRSRSYPARLASVLMNTAHAPIDLMLYSTGYPYSLKNALFTSDDCLSPHRYSAFGVMSAYSHLYRLGTRVDTGENFRRELYTLGALSASEGAVLIATDGYSGTLEISVSGGDFDTYSIKGMLGGGKRGTGFSTEEGDIPLGCGSFTLKVGKSEIYLITLTRRG